MDGLTRGFEELLGPNLAGVYLHGSLAMGCFNSRGSDVDLLVITERRMPPEVWRAVARLVMRLSKRPAPVEVSVMRRSQLRPFRHPAPFDLHFGHEHLPWYRRMLRSGRWRSYVGHVKRDADLAAHLTVTRARGIRLAGGPVGRVIPPVARRLYLDSVRTDLAWSRAHGTGTYAILNLCRSLAFMRTGRVLSKAEGGRWALGRFGPVVRPLIRRALREYAATNHRNVFTAAELAAFRAAMPTV